MIEREPRIFKPVLRLLGKQKQLKSIKLADIREYQKQRRREVSPTMKVPVSGRTINYEMKLLRGIMVHADCWSADLDARYIPLRQLKSRRGRVATKEQLIKMITVAQQRDE